MKVDSLGRACGDIVPKDAAAFTHAGNRTARFKKSDKAMDALPAIGKGNGMHDDVD